MWQVERDAAFDVVTEAEVAERRQCDVEDNDDAHRDIKSAREALWLTHLVLYRKNLRTHTHSHNYIILLCTLKPHFVSTTGTAVIQAATNSTKLNDGSYDGAL